MELIEEFEEYMSSRKAKCTCNSYSFTVRKWLRFAADRGMEMDRASVNAYISAVEKTGVSPQTVRIRFAAILYFFKWQGRETELKGIELPRHTNPKMIALTREQVGSLIRACANPTETAMIISMYGCALRVGEMLRMEMADICEDDGFLRVHSETGRTAEDVIEPIPVDSSIMKFLRDYAKTEKITTGKLFPTYNYKGVLRTMQRLCKTAGVTMDAKQMLGTHAFRRARATHLDEDNVPPLTIQRFMRHKDFRTTQRYIHVSDVALKEKITPALDANLKVAPRRE